MSNQAVAGMTAGLITQPRYRKSSFLASGDVSKLKKQVHDLELKVTTQQKLIEILKSLPAAQNRQNATEMESGGSKKARRAAKAKCRPKSSDGKARKPINDGASVECLGENPEIVETASEVELTDTQAGSTADSGQAS